MGYDLADGEDKIEVTLRDKTIDLRGPRITQLAFGLFVDESGGNFAEGFDIGAPIVDAEEILRYIAEHVRDLVRAHGGVGAESGKNGLEPVAIVLPRIGGEFAGAGVLTALVGRDDEHTVARTKLRERFREQVL